MVGHGERLRSRVSFSEISSPLLLKLSSCPSVVDSKRLEAYLLASQVKGGGFSAHVGEQAVRRHYPLNLSLLILTQDLYHTHFAVLALSLLGHTGLEAVDPVFALPIRFLPKK